MTGWYEGGNWGRTVLNRKLGRDREDDARVVEGVSGHCNGSVWRDLMVTEWRRRNSLMGRGLGRRQKLG